MKIERIKITGARAPVFHLFFIHLPRDRDKIVSCLMVFSPAKAGFSIYCYFIMLNICFVKLFVFLCGMFNIINL